MTEHSVTPARMGFDVQSVYVMYNDVYLTDAYGKMWKTTAAWTSDQVEAFLQYCADTGADDEGNQCPAYFSTDKFVPVTHERKVKMEPVPVHINDFCTDCEHIGNPRCKYKCLLEAQDADMLNDPLYGKTINGNQW